MNKGTYTNLLDTILKEQVEIIQSKKRDNDFDAVNGTCLINIVYLMAHLTDEVSSVADEIKALREEIANSKGKE